MVSSSAGLRCPDCAFNRPLTSEAAPITSSSPGMSAFAGLLTGLAGAYVLALLSSFLPLLTLLAAPFYGRFVADAVISFYGDGRGRKMEAIGVGSVLLGSMVVLMSPFGAVRTQLSGAGMDDISQAIVGIAFGLAVTVCYSRLKPKRP
jgi:hypothetical protein